MYVCEYGMRIVFRFPFHSFLVLPTCKYKCTCACGRSIHVKSIQKMHRHDWRTNFETRHLFVLVCSKRPQQLSFVVHSLAPIAWRQAPHVLRLNTAPSSLHPALPTQQTTLNPALTSKDADKEKVEKAARPMPPRTTKVLAFQFLGLANHPPEGVQMCVGK